MAELRESIAALLFLTFVAMPVWSASSTTFGTVLLAQRAHIGMAPASAGTTVFGGDKISTDQLGNIQIRAGVARLMLRESSSATISELNGTPSATLLGGNSSLFDRTCQRLRLARRHGRDPATE